MKKKINLVLALSLSAIMMQSCAVSSVSSEEKNVEIKEDRASACFVEMKDGSIRRFKSLKLVTGVFSAPHLLANGKEKIGAADIKAYQDHQVYAISQDAFKDNKRSKSAVATLPGFAVRIAGGELNIYSKRYFNGSGTAEQLFVQEGNGEIMAFSPEIMNNLLKNHPEAAKFFQASKNITPISKRLQATVALLKPRHALSKN